MNNLHEVKLNLTDAQLKKLMKTTVQLSNVDVGHGQSFYVTKKVKHVYLIQKNLMFIN